MKYKDFSKIWPKKMLPTNHFGNRGSSKFLFQGYAGLKALKAQHGFTPQGMQSCPQVTGVTHSAQGRASRAQAGGAQQPKEEAASQAAQVFGQTAHLRDMHIMRAII